MYRLSLKHFLSTLSLTVLYPNQGTSLPFKDTWLCRDFLRSQEVLPQYSYSSVCWVDKSEITVSVHLMVYTLLSKTHSAVPFLDLNPCRFSFLMQCPHPHPCFTILGFLFFFFFYFSINFLLFFLWFLGYDMENFIAFTESTTFDLYVDRSMFSVRFQNFLSVYFLTKEFISFQPPPTMEWGPPFYMSKVKVVSESEYIPNKHLLSEK